jgi:signal transduction histidine kinase
MFQFNLRQKMIGCFTLHFLFYVFLGITFLKDFELFEEDVSLLMQAGSLSNTCLEIRRYEKNYIIRHNEEDYKTVVKYVHKAIQNVPAIVNDLKIMPHPPYLNDLSSKLVEYRDAFRDYKENCSSNPEVVCPQQEILRSLGQDLVQISAGLVRLEQEKMADFIKTIRRQLITSISLLCALTIFTLIILYYHIVLPLKKIEKAARQVAKGTFTLLPLPKKVDEVSSVLYGFNSMVSELEQHQEQLFQAKKLSSIGTLASGTAHQINNPLNNISTSCQLAISEIEGGRDCQFVARMLQTIEQETQRAGEIVRGLLEFSRVQTFTIKPILFEDVVNKVLRLVASEVPPGVTITKNIPADLTLNLDVQKMVEALLNLLINAIHAISETPGLIFIKAVAHKKSNKAIITVEDNGSGINPENIPKIFDPFFTTKNGDIGTGLGLAVVYGIIKKQNGSIKVESELGKGTRFIITLPLGHESAQQKVISDTDNLE